LIDAESQSSDELREDVSVRPSEDEPLPIDLKSDFAPLKQSHDAGDVANSDGDPYHQDSLLAQESFQRGVEAANRGDEAEAVQQYLVASKRAETAREWYLAAVSFHRVGDFLQHPKPPFDLERAFRMYRRAVAAYEQSGYFDDARRLAYRMMLLRMRRARTLQLKPWRRVELFVYWALAGFGYRPLRVMGSAMVVILAYGVLFWALNGVTPAMPAAQPVTFWDCVYFSGITFTTLGYGDLMPAADARLLALTEATIGMFTMGFLVVVFANRLRH
jgi:TPR repeat protein